MQADEEAEHAGVVRDLEPLDLEMVLWLAVAGVSQFVREPVTIGTTLQYAW